MIKALKFVLLAVLFVGFSPAMAALHEEASLEKQVDRLKGQSFHELSAEELDSGCLFSKDRNCIDGAGQKLSGQEGGGIVTPEEEDELLKKRHGLGEDELFDQGLPFEERNYDLVRNMEAMGFKLRNAVYYGSEGNNPSGTEADYCENCVSGPKGQEGGDPDPSNGFRVWDVKIIGGSDERIEVKAQHAREASAVGMLVCSKEVNGKTLSAVSTGTFVGNKSTVLASAHGVYAHDSNGNRKYRFDIKRDCEFRQYTNGQLTFKSEIIGAEFGDNVRREESANDWSVLRLKKPSKNARPLPASKLKMDKVNTDSRIPVELIAYHHDTKNVRSLYYSKGTIRRAVDPYGNTVLGHTADTNGRASGGALIYRKSDGSSVIFGIHAGGLVGQDLNKAVPINSTIIKAIKSAVNATSVST